AIQVIYVSAVRKCALPISPRSSVACAVSEYLPAATLVQVKLGGLFVDMPKWLVPAKKSPRATDPSLSVAPAWMVMLAGSVKVAPDRKSVGEGKGRRGAAVR